MCYKTECSAVLITFKWLSTFVYLSFAERHLRGSHKGLTFNIISPSNNSFFSQMNPGTLHFGKYLPQLTSDRSGHISGRSCLHSFFLLFIPVFRNVCLFFLANFLFTNMCRAGRRQKEEIESARTISTVQSLHTG